MKRVLVSALVIAITSFVSTASAGCHHHRAMRLIYVPAAPVYQAPVMHSFQTIGGPGPTTFHESAPVYGQPITESVSAPMVQAVEVAAPVVAETIAVEAAPVVESIPIGDTHSVDTIEETPIATEAEAVAVEAVVEAAPAPDYVAPAPVQYVEVAPAAPVFVETPPANRAHVVETYYQPQMMYFQPAPVIIMQAPSRGCRHCRLH